MRDEEKILKRIEDILRNIDNIHEWNKSYLPRICETVYYVPVYIDCEQYAIHKTNIALIPDYGVEVFDKIEQIDERIFECYLTANNISEAYTKALEMVIAKFKSLGIPQYITALRNICFTSEECMIDFLTEECNQRRKIIQSEIDETVPEVSI